MRLTRSAAPIGLVVLAALVMSFRLGSKDLWNDEAFSFFVAHRGAAATLRFIGQDTQPPLYYLVLRYWLRLGHGVLVLRSLSVVAMVLTVLPLYGAARRLFGPAVAALAGMLFVVTPFITSWSQKARPYPLQTLLLAVAFWGFIEVFCAAEARADWIGQGTARALRTRRAGTVRTDLAWLAYALGSGLAMLTQQPAGFFVLGCNVTILLATMRQPWKNRRLLGNWTIAQLLGISVWALWLPGFLRQIATNLTPAQIVARHTNFLIDGWGVLGGIEGLFGVGGLWRAAPPFLAVQVVLGAIGAILLIRRGRALPVLGPMLLPIAVCVLGFWFVHPIFGYVITTFVFTWLPYSILLAYAILHLRPRLLGAAFLAVILLGDAWGLRNYQLAPTPPIAAVARVIRERMQPGDGVILSDNVAMRWGLAYYLGPKLRHELSGLDVSAEWDYDKLIRTPEAALRHRRVWVVLPGGRQASSVSLDLLRERMRIALRYRIDSATVLLFRGADGG